ncbi:hypothetical protein D4764_12G0010490 [Takifugu flavidus]|uniref:DDE Tnp4 domain-containing protein n=1 Tax=Takifugu flavidus TaxID=433684 RepID=A0A5C6PF77_9TELE|nr:hypothetical protein D4764_12G0010490 [Takifugu flavidus]
MYIDGQTDLRPDFRLSRSTVAKLIDVLRSPFDHGWGLEVEVLVYLFWLASATSYRVVSRGFSIPRSTVFDIVHRMSDKVLSLKNRTIKFPSLVDIPNIAAGFQRLSGSPALQNVVGSIDGCHIRIKPPGAHAQCYFNRKLFYSIQLQAVCDHQGLFIDIFTGYPGSVHEKQPSAYSPGYTVQGASGEYDGGQNGDSMDPSKDALGSDDTGQMQPDLQCGEQIRNRLAAALSAPTHLPPALQEHDYI